MPVSVESAHIEEKDCLRKLLDDCLSELSVFVEGRTEVRDVKGYPWFDAYWDESGRYPLLIRRNGAVVGFAFVRDTHSMRETASEIAEFYIVPERRQGGVGRQAVSAIWQRFPGTWRLQVHLRNTVGVKFWQECMENSSVENVASRTICAEDGERLEFTFSTGRFTS